MRVSDALAVIQQFDALVLGDKTFEPLTIDQVVIDSGEIIWWAHGSDNTWISIDVDSDELIHFNDVDEEMTIGKEIVSFAGDEYEFSYESAAKIMSEDGEEERVSFREYELPSGEVIRLLQYEVSGEEVAAYGLKIAEDAVHAA